MRLRTPEAPLAVVGALLLVAALVGGVEAADLRVSVAGSWWVRVLLGLLGLLLLLASMVAVDEPAGPASPAVPGVAAALSAPAPPVAGRARGERLTVHYHRPDGGYAGWQLHVWGDVHPSARFKWPRGVPFDANGGFGATARVRLRAGARQVGFVVVRDGIKDVANDRLVTVTETDEVWLRSGDPRVFASAADALGYARVHYRRPDGDYAGWSLHVWGNGLLPAANTTWEEPLPPDGVDDFGLLWRVALFDARAWVGFIVHRGDEKDPGPDQHLVPARTADGYVVSGDPVVYPSAEAAIAAAG
ncbi:MAG TPA: pullulanase-associated domain-containing protein [Pseudonocardiaceae bacterium]|nr:pullulanase-associated domain-containing protein [Pseudonocardiaceae bacterium]